MIGQLGIRRGIDAGGVTGVAGGYIHQKLECIRGLGTGSASTS